MHDPRGQAAPTGPRGTLLGHTGRSGGDIVIRLLDPAHPDETDWNRIRLNLRKPKPVEKDLREQLAENPAALHVSDAQRERAIDFLITRRNARNPDQKYGRRSQTTPNRPVFTYLRPTDCPALREPEA
jgi:hypothetical protein